MNTNYTCERTSKYNY